MKPLNLNHAAISIAVTLFIVRVGIVFGRANFRITELLLVTMGVVLAYILGTGNAKIK